jgi:hypothetical protein
MRLVLLLPGLLPILANQVSAQPRPQEEEASQEEESSQEEKVPSKVEKETTRREEVTTVSPKPEEITADVMIGGL